MNGGFEPKLLVKDYYRCPDGGQFRLCCEVRKEVERLVTERAPELMASHGIATLTVAEMLIPVGDDPTRIRSKAAFRHQELPGADADDFGRPHRHDATSLGK